MYNQASDSCYINQLKSKVIKDISIYSSTNILQKQEKDDDKSIKNKNSLAFGINDPS